MSLTDSKTAEFARLFELFEHLANRKSRVTVKEESIDDSVPEDLAPVIKSLATIVGTRNAGSPTKAFERPRRNTVAGGLSTTDSTSSDSEDGDESLAKFPVNKQFPFTFKMMLHKLYQVEDWGRKVKEMLEKSQMEFKPLAEQQKEQVADVEMEVEKNKASLRMPASRPRSQSMAGMRNLNGVDLKKDSERREEVRALKKRCVGRRKSFSAPTAGNGWVYDSAISASEVSQRRAVVKFANIDSEPPKTAPANRTRYQSLGLGHSRPVITRRRMSAGAPLPPGSPPALFQVLTNQDELGGRRRAMTVADSTSVPEGDATRKRRHVS